MKMKMPIAKLKPGEKYIGLKPKPRRKKTTAKKPRK